MSTRGACLVIEDDADIQGLISLILSAEGFEVHTEETGTAGLLAASQRQLALITLDIGLPDIDGREIARQLRTVSSAPLLMITAFAETADELAGMAAGASAYLAKPFRPAQLRALVTEFCPAPQASRLAGPAALVRCREQG
ncbi:response regulator [Paenarthrobacter sp. CC6]|uniref:response regulator transcription factor n=1 Tax=Paenarthrobacter sp. CC6 TaxID=3029184 RepID=UPI00339C63D3